MEFLIYLFCLGIGLVFTLITALTSHIFGHDSPVAGSHGHVEAGADFSDMPGVSAFSPTVISSFVTAFGGFGVVLSQYEITRPAHISAPLAILGGLIIAAVFYFFLRQLFQKTQSSSEGQVGALVGIVATIITPIPENGVGEIAYIQGGTRYTAPAREEHGIAVSSGKPVKITRILGTQFYVSAAI